MLQGFWVGGYTEISEKASSLSAFPSRKKENARPYRVNGRPSDATACFVCRFLACALAVAWGKCIFPPANTTCWMIVEGFPRGLGFFFLLICSVRVHATDTDCQAARWWAFLGHVSRSPDPRYAATFLCLQHTLSLSRTYRRARARLYVWG